MKENISVIYSENSVKYTGNICRQNVVWPVKITENCCLFYRMYVKSYGYKVTEVVVLTEIFWCLCCQKFSVNLTEDF